MAVSNTHCWQADPRCVFARMLGPPRLLELLADACALARGAGPCLRNNALRAPVVVSCGLSGRELWSGHGPPWCCAARLPPTTRHHATCTKKREEVHRKPWRDRIGKHGRTEGKKRRPSFAESSSSKAHPRHRAESAELDAAEPRAPSRGRRAEGAAPRCRAESIRGTKATAPAQSGAGGLAVART